MRKLTVRQIMAGVAAAAPIRTRLSAVCHVWPGHLVVPHLRVSRRPPGRVRYWPGSFSPNLLRSMSLAAYYRDQAERFSRDADRCSVRELVPRYRQLADHYLALAEQAESRNIARTRPARSSAGE